MRKVYDFSKARSNPYVKRLKKQVTIRLEEEVISYFNPSPQIPCEFDGSGLSSRLDEISR